MIREKCKVLSNDKIGDGIRRLLLAAPQVASAAAPGQFVMLEVSRGFDPFLKRPMGLNVIDQENGVIACVYRVIGRGTELLCRIKPGNEMFVLGPCGQPWPQAEAKIHLLVGGGMGIAPLPPLAQALAQKAEVRIVVGANSAAELYSLAELGACGDLTVATLDGGLGNKGLVTSFLPEPAASMVVHTCGPEGMMRAVSTWAAEHKLPCYLSLDKRMGCGIGTCMGCVIKVRQGGKTVNKRVCHDGPVFAAEEVVFDD